MSDCRYPWERDPQHEPPHTRQRFENNIEELHLLRSQLKLAMEALRKISKAGEGGFGDEDAITCYTDEVSGTARNTLAEIEKMGKKAY